MHVKILSNDYLAGCEFQKTNEQAIQLNERAEQMLACNHYDPGRVRALAEDVLLRWVVVIIIIIIITVIYLCCRWRRLVMLTEERHKLLCAAVPYFKSIKQVTLWFIVI